MNTKNRFPQHGKQEIEYGDVDVAEEAFSPAATRRRISIMIPEDVISALTAMGERDNIGYQTVINQILRNAVMPENTILSSLARIEHALKIPSHTSSYELPGGGSLSDPEGTKRSKKQKIKVVR